MEVARKTRGTSGQLLGGETGWLNRRDDQIDNGSSSVTVDEGRRGVVVDDVVGEEASAGWRTEEGVGLRRFSASVYKWVGGWDRRGEPWLRDALVRNVGQVTKVLPPI